MSQIGRSVPRVEGREKVTGIAEYIHNMRVPGMLHAKIFRSNMPHGRIRSIDTSQAAAMPGVHDVYTGADIQTVIPDPLASPYCNQPLSPLENDLRRESSRCSIPFGC